MTFTENIRGLQGQYDKNLNKLVLDSTERIFYLRKMNNNELSSISIKNINLGCFYLIKYNYNGNKIYCPIFTLEYKVIKNKNILYAINLDYLPYTYKSNFFINLMNFYKQIYDDNIDINDATNEKPLPNITFEKVYRLLKSNGGYEFSVTAFDILKITEVCRVSTNILHRFLFLNTRMVNSALMKNLVSTDMLDEYKEKLKEIIDVYDNMKISYEEDTKEFYKRLRNFESNYKIIDNPI